LVYHHVTPEDVAAIVSESLSDRAPDQHFDERKCAHQKDIPFFLKQRRIILSGHEYIDPKSIDDYIAQGGYSALSRALLGMRPEEVIEEIGGWGLQSRSGAGQPSSQKWLACRRRGNSGKPPVVLCNANEGDPGGGQVARALLEANPHRVIEGMTIAAFSVGSGSGHVYLRSSHSLAAKHLAIALSRAREYGILGKNILGSGFDFDLTLYCENGFTCGESGEYPASLSRVGYEADTGDGCPVLWDTVETWVNVPTVIGRGWSKSSHTDTEAATSTKIFSLVGSTNNTGLVEVPLGATLQEVVFDIGGGVRNGKALKGTYVGGPAGGFIPASRVDLKMDSENLAKAGASIGSGSIVVLDEGNCIVEMTRYLISFLADSPCGKCAGCYVGLSDMADLLDRVTKGHGKQEDIFLLERLAKGIKTGSLCPTGASAADPVLSSLGYFVEEYQAHVEGTCPSGTCKSLIKLSIDPAICSGCGECAEECPERAISGRPGTPHTIDHRLCVRCRICQEVCELEAVTVS